MTETTLKVNNLDLAFTVDTYGTFTQDSDVESEIEYYNDEHGTELNYDDFDWTYDHAGYVKHLSENSVSILENQFVNRGIVKKIELESSKSPQFYNYTTDSYTAYWTVDTEALKKFTLDNFKEYETFAKENWTTLEVNWNDRTYIGGISEDVKYDMFENEDVQVSMLDFYTRHEYDDGNAWRVDKTGESYFDDESYIMEMFEAQQGSEYITFKLETEVK